ncbi:hypothetical protein CYMTET_41827, partial [Cymbomonas tetramitiformis]
GLYGKTEERGDQVVSRGSQSTGPTTPRGSNDRSGNTEGVPQSANDAWSPHEKEVREKVATLIKKAEEIESRNEWMRAPRMSVDTPRQHLALTSQAGGELVSRKNAPRTIDLGGGI